VSLLVVLLDLTVDSVVYKFSSLGDDRIPAYTPKIVGSARFTKSLADASYGTQSDIEVSLSLSNIDTHSVAAPTVSVLSLTHDLTQAGCVVSLIDLETLQTVRNLPGRITSISGLDQQQCELRIQGRVFRDLNVMVPKLLVRDVYPSAVLVTQQQTDEVVRMSWGRHRQVPLVLVQQRPLIATFTFTRPLAENFYALDITSAQDTIVQGGMALYYDVSWIGAAYVTLDPVLSDGTRLGQTSATDQNAKHPTLDDLSSYMVNGWYRRRIPLPAAWIGRTITQYLVTSESNVGGTYTGFIHNAYIGDADGEVLTEIATAISPPLTTVAGARNADGTNNTGSVVVSESFDYGALYQTNGAAIHFNGTGKIDCGAQLAFERSNPWSIDLIVKTPVAGAQVLVGKYDPATGGGIGYSIELTALGKLLVMISHGTGNRIVVTGTATMTNDLKHFVTVTYSGNSLASGIKLYVDGIADTVTVAENTLSQTILNAAPFLIGMRSTGTPQGLNGDIDEIRIWDHALSAATATQSQHYTMPAIREDPGLLFYMNFDEQVWAVQAAKERVLGQTYTITNGTVVSGLLSTVRITACYRDGAVVDPAEWAYMVSAGATGVIRFGRSQVDSTGRAAAIAVDVFSWAFDENHARVAQFLLSSTPYGAGLSVDSAACSSAATALSAAGYRAAGGLIAQEKLPGLFPDLFLRGTIVELNVNLAYSLTVDAAALYTSSNLALGHGDEYLNNCEVVPASFLDESKRIRSVQLHGGHSARLGSGDQYRLHTTPRARSVGGREINETRRFIDDALTLDTEACYLWERLQLEDTVLGVKMGSRGRDLTIRNTVLLTAPQLQLDRALFVVGSEELSIDADRGASFTYAFFPNRVNRFVYTALPVTIDDPGQDVTDYAFTLPPAPLNLTITQLVTFVNSAGQVESRVALSATAADGNGDRLVFRIYSFLTNALVSFETVQITPGGSGIAVLAVSPGTTVVPQAYTRNTRNNAGFQDGFVNVGTAFLVPMDSDVPTNNPVPATITVSAQPDGSMRVKLTWTYTQGAILAEAMILFAVQGTAPLAAPSVFDQAQVLDAGARTYTWDGLNPSSNFRFGIAAGRWPHGGGLSIGAMQSPLTSPDWADISTVGNYTGLVAGVDAATLVAGSASNANGQAAFDGTVNYRLTGAPTNNPSPTTFSAFVNADASVDYAIGWNYTQGAKRADGFFVFQHDGDAPAVLTDAHFGLVASTNVGTFSARFTVKGAPTERVYSFGVAAYRRTDNNIEIGTIIGSLISPDWQGVSAGTPNFVGTIFNLEQHSFVATSSGRAATNGAARLLKDNQDLIWNGRDPEFLNGIHGVFGPTYNLTVYDLINRVVVYQHCFDLMDFGSAAVAADLMGAGASGGGSVASGAVGQFGLGAQLIASTGQIAQLGTTGPSTLYSGLGWIELWFKHAGNPTAVGTILGVSSIANGVGGYNLALLYLNTNGRVTAQAFNGFSTFTATHSTVVTDGNFHHLAASVQGGDLRLWVDGVGVGVVVGGLTSFTMGAPGGGLYLFSGFVSNQGQLLGTTIIDEIIVTTNQTLRASAANFAVPTTETADWVAGLPGTYALFHFQEPWLTVPYINSRKAPKALANLIQSYIDYQHANPAARWQFIVQGCYNAQANRTVDGLPDVLEKIGSRKTLFLGGTFQAFSAYTLVGEPDKGPGNGIEAYAGSVADATDAMVEVNWQTQASHVIGGIGTGWDALLIPGPPSNNPTPTFTSVSTSTVGQEVITIGWSYTQPALTGTNRLADGFVVYVHAGDTGTPATAASKNSQVDINSRAYTMQAPLGTSWSFAVAAYRKTASGVEIGTPITSGISPDWQGIGGNTLITTPGITDGNITTLKLSDLGVTTGKLSDLGVVTGKLGDLVVTNPKLGNFSVDANKRAQFASVTVSATLPDANHQHTNAGGANTGGVLVNTGVLTHVAAVFNHNLGQIPSTAYVGGGILAVLGDLNSTTATVVLYQHFLSFTGTGTFPFTLYYR